MKMNDCQDLMAEDDELQLRVLPVLDHDIRMPSCGERRPSRMERINIRRHKQKFFTVYDGLSKCHQLKTCFHFLKKDSYIFLWL